MNPTPNCHLYRFYPRGRPPMRADRSSGGTLPVRAIRYCEPMTLASGFGWWLFPPVDTLVSWDGHTILWSTDGQPWEPVDDAVHFPGFPDEFDERVPDALKGAAHPYLTALPEPGVIKVSLGVIARTGEGWCSLLRRPANFPLPGHIEHYEGVLATDHHACNLFINLRLTKTDFQIRLRENMPIAQLQPIPRAALATNAITDLHIHEFSDEAEWQLYETAIASFGRRPDRPFGEYAATERRWQHERSLVATPVA